MSRHHDDGDDPGEHVVMDPDPGQTESGWSVLLRLCELQRSIGFGALDSFLSGPDLERRVALVETHARSNEWLRVELRDTLGLDHSSEWTPEHHDRLKRVALEPRE